MISSVPHWRSASDMDFIDLLIEQKQRDEKYFFHYREYGLKIKHILEELLKSNKIRLLLFGSVVKGTWVPNRSDIDILVISPEVQFRAKWQSELRKRVFDELGDSFAPFEIHFATQETYEIWYSKFIKDSFLEV
jgi:predicted nucleotidyltransferase